MQVRDRHENEHTALTRLGGDFTRRKTWRGGAVHWKYLNNFSLSTSENQVWNKILSLFKRFLSSKYLKACHMGVKMAQNVQSQGNVYCYFNNVLLIL